MRFPWPSPRSIALSLTLLALSLSASADPHATARQHFERGNRAYAAAQFTDAIAAYQQALRTGFTSGALHYNLANAYYRVGQYGEALLHYEKTRRFLADDPRLAHNLAVVHDRVGSAPLPRLAWLRWLEAINVWMLFIVGTGIYFTGIGGACWTRGRRAWISLAVLGVVLMGGAMAVSYGRTLDLRGVVTAPAALRSTPTETAPTDTTIGEGTVLRVQQRRTGWTEVHLPNDRVGWLPAPSVADI